MFIQSSLSDKSTFFQKLRSLDYIMLLTILIIDRHELREQIRIQKTIKI